MSTRRAICQHTICSRHDPFKTHFTMLVSVSHSMSTSPVIEYVAPASAVTYTELSPVTEYVAPAPADTLAARSPAIDYEAPTPVVAYAAPSSVIEYVALAPVVFHAAPATVIERSSLWRIGHEHSSTSERGEKRSDDAMHLFLSLVRLVFSCPKLPDPRIFSNFQNYHYQP